MFFAVFVGLQETCKTQQCAALFSPAQVTPGSVVPTSGLSMFVADHGSPQPLTLNLSTCKPRNPKPEGESFKPYPTSVYVKTGYT